MNGSDGSLMAYILNIIKCGLFSSNLDICNICSKVLSKIAQDINEEFEGGELYGLAWEWFVNNKNNINNQFDNKTLDNV